MLVLTCAAEVLGGVASGSGLEADGGRGLTHSEFVLQRDHPFGGTHILAVDPVPDGDFKFATIQWVSDFRMNQLENLFGSRRNARRKSLRRRKAVVNAGFPVVAIFDLGKHQVTDRPVSNLKDGLVYAWAIMTVEDFGRYQNSNLQRFYIAIPAVYNKKFRFPF